MQVCFEVGLPKLETITKPLERIDNVCTTLLHILQRHSALAIKRAEKNATG